MIINNILLIAPPGTCIPKPQARGDFIVKGIGKRRDEKALIYLIPNHKNPNAPYQKRITFSELEKSYMNLDTLGEFSREWFDKHLPECSREGDAISQQSADYLNCSRWRDTLEKAYT